MAVEFTRWFSIDKDGQPARAGWYEVLYHGDRAEDGGPTFYWDGAEWRFDSQSRASTAFGNEDTRGERWRGLTAPAK